MSNRDADGDKGEPDDSDSNLREIAHLVLVIAVVLFALTTITMMFGYTDYLTAQGTEEACQQKYGESAEYVGDTSSFGGSGICGTEDGQKYIEKELAPMNFNTLGGYLSQVELV